MSESDHHRNLVQALADEISSALVWGNAPIVYCDIQNGCSSDLPPIIGSNRPDVFAKDIAKSLSIIGEAKTGDDIDNRHTLTQLASFFDYLRHEPQGELWMGVPWLFAGTALRICTSVRRKVGAEDIPIRVVGFVIGDTTLRRIWRE